MSTMSPFQSHFKESLKISIDGYLEISQIPHKTIQILISFVETHLSEIRSCHLAFAQQSEPLLSRLLAILASSKALTSLKIRAKKVEDRSLRTLFKGIIANPESLLTSLELSIPKIGVAPLIEFFAINTTVTSVNLGFTDLNGEKLAGVLAAIARNSLSPLTTLGLSHNAIVPYSYPTPATSAIGLPYLEDFLATNTTVTSLDIGSNNLDDDNLVRVLKSIASNPQGVLALLDASSNKITSVSVDYLGKVRETSHTLSSLKLKINTLDDNPTSPGHSIGKLLSGVVHHPQSVPAFLDLSSKKITSVATSSQPHGPADNLKTLCLKNLSFFLTPPVNAQPVLSISTLSTLNPETISSIERAGLVNRN